MSYKGKFKPKNRAKYKGDHTAITYRSLWELRFMRYLDTTPSVLKWSSEEIVIPYRSPIDGRRHRYFPDFWVKVKTSEGLVKESLIEVKPKAQCSPPKGAPPKDRRKRGRFIREVKTWGINEAKWKAAKAYCDDRKWGWKILTEDDLTKY
tara:strand:+ start:230 stop:679 length:450 start_codon:yes stop_codon:yes gene_type:complete